MSDDKGSSMCYNRGCAKNFDPDNNKDGDCVYHPGVPVFHDAYKGWSCCKKKCIDFTEFLNIKGCTVGRHNGEKPVEPEKPTRDDSPDAEIIEVRPMQAPSLPRPPYDSPQITLNPIVSPTLLEQIKGLTATSNDVTGEPPVTIGQSCHNKSCKATYRGNDSDSEVCVYHPGVPIFHEGLKYWSCCSKKKTTDFSVFLELPGCTHGVHQWIAKKTTTDINCRMDWHQTGSFIVVSIFAKKYKPSESSVKLNPIRLTVDLFFVEEDARYKLDTELSGVVNVEESSVSMLPTKVEIKLKKAEPGVWSKLSCPRSCDDKPAPQEKEDKEEISERVEAVDLSDL